MNCSYCNSAMNWHAKLKKFICHNDDRYKKKANGFLDNQVLCLPYLKFVEQYPEVVLKKRFQIFEAIGQDCVTCGLIGSHIVWWKEFHVRSDGSQSDHFDIAGYKDGKLIMITIDHIYPKSLGGADSINNYQPMCSPCNGKKSNKVL